MHDPIDELKLTAYAIGELNDPAERERVEAHLADDPAGRKLVAEARATAALVRDELAKEPDVAMTALHHAAIERRLAGERPMRSGDPIPLRRNWALWGSLAASVVIVTTVTATVIVPMLNAGGGSGIGKNWPRRTSPGETIPDGPIGLPPMILLPELPSGKAGGDGDYPSLPPAPMPRPQADGTARFVRVGDTPITSAPLTPRRADDSSAFTAMLANVGSSSATTVTTHDLIDAAVGTIPAARDGDRMALSVESADCPWNPKHRLVRIAVGAPGPATRPSTEATPTTRPAVAGVEVGIDIEFNPSAAAGYRLVGYESPRGVAGNVYITEQERIRVRFAEGQIATALFEVVPFGLPVPADDLTPQRPGLKYHQLSPSPAAAGGELLTATLSWREPGTHRDRTVQQPASAVSRPVASVSDDFRAAAAAAAIGLRLHKPTHSDGVTVELVTGLITTLDSSSPRSAALSAAAAKLRETDGTPNQ